MKIEKEKKKDVSKEKRKEGRLQNLYKLIVSNSAV